MDWNSQSYQIIGGLGFCSKWAAGDGQERICFDKIFCIRFLFCRLKMGSHEPEIAGPVVLRYFHALSLSSVLQYLHTSGE